MDDRQPQLALREIRAQFRRPRSWGLAMGVAAILAIVGAFDTDKVLRPLPLFLYWLVLVMLTYCVGALSGAAAHAVGARRLPRWLLLLVVGLATGAGVSCAVALVNVALFGLWLDPQDWPAFLAATFGISMIVTVLLNTPSAPGDPKDTALPRILERLPIEKRGALVALSVADHYVHIRTTEGEEMLLLRLADAMGEVGATPGLQVHRSHWVATDQVQAARREGDRAILTMTYGPEIPVSRRYVPALREAGLLPR